MDVQGSRAVVTGGASGIGRAIVDELAQRGCRVLIADIDGDRARAVAAEVGQGAVGARCDVSDHADVCALAELAQNAMGGVNLVFANAGVSVGGLLLDATPEELNWIFGVNVRGAWNTASVFGRRLRDASQPGHICLTGSEHSLGLQHTGMGLYTATKQALFGLADVLRAELSPGIGVSLLCPGLVNTELHLSKRHSPLPQNDELTLAFGAAVLAQGMAAEEVGRAAVEGVARGEPLIVTHPAALAAAKARHDALAAAFAAQAPWTDDAARFEVNTAVATVSQAWAQRAAAKDAK